MNSVMRASKSIDPQWAWDSFEPDADHPWDERAAAHLFRRAGFGASPAMLQKAVAQSPTEVAEALVRESAAPDPQRASMESLAESAMAGGNVENLSAWWVYRMLSTSQQLREKTTLFWHGHFATSASKVEDARLMWQQYQLLREYAMGDFRELALEISRDPAMLIWLDSVSNRKAHPNENYAREIMELFCLGEGNYSEADIRELAKCFTGWEVKRRQFRFNRYQHDTGTKSVLGQSGEFGGEEAVGIVVASEHAPVFIASRLVRYFVMDEPSADAALIAPLAEQLRQNDMNVLPVIQRILTSNLFYSEHAVGRKIKSPVELAVGLLRSLEGTANTVRLAQALKRLGQGLFYPPSVKGWDGGRAWINSSTLLGRSNLVRQILTDDKTRFGRASLQEWLEQNDARSPDEIISLFETLLFAAEVPSDARPGITRLLAAGGETGLIDGLHALCTLPLFQLG